jgi:hypothetical protein
MSMNFIHNSQLYIKIQFTINKIRFMLKTVVKNLLPLFHGTVKKLYAQFALLSITFLEIEKDGNCETRNSSADSDLLDVSGSVLPPQNLRFTDTLVIFSRFTCTSVLQNVSRFHYLWYIIVYPDRGYFYQIN